MLESKHAETGIQPNHPGKSKRDTQKNDAGKEMQSSSGKKEAERVKMEKVSVADGQGK